MQLPLTARRRAVTASGEGMVRVAPLDPGHAIPVLVTPAVPGVDLVDWGATHRDQIDRLLVQHKALLFRGFHDQRADRFTDFVRATAQGEPLEYVDRTTPRTRLGDGLYTSTIYPAQRRIEMHNEGTYWTSWPLKLYFACATAADSGGETPLADVARVLGRLSPALVERFTSVGFLLERNYNDGFGLPWQEVFQTDDRAEVEAYCRDNDIAFEWRDGDRLRTRQVRPAIRRNPRTGERVWFNHAAFFHLSSYPAEVRAGLLAEVGREGLPYNTFFGDGTEIPSEAIAEVRAAYAAEKVQFTWQPGDVLLLENMSVAHGREPFTGDRLVLASMNEPYAGDE